MAYSTTWIAAPGRWTNSSPTGCGWSKRTTAPGFYGYHVAEHHATPLGVAPSPGIWLAAIAQRTTQLRFGALVYLLPLYHPLKLLEELCMLDQMSRGRLLLGVGRGISPIELRYYGLDPEQTPAMYQEALEVILRGMACKELTFEGKYYQYRDVPMEIEPYQKPHPPLWYGIGRLDAVPWAVQHRVNVVGNITGTGMRPLTDRYRAEWAAAGNAPHDLPLMGVGRHVVVADTEREALEVARRGYGKWRESFLKLWRKHGMLPAQPERDVSQRLSRKPKPKAAPSLASPTRCATSCNAPSTMAASTICSIVSRSVTSPPMKRCTRSICSPGT